MAFTGKEKPILAAWARGTGLTEEGALGPLLRERRWLAWKLHFNGVKWTKVPLRVNDKGEVSAGRSNRPEEGQTYAVCRDAVLAGRADGVGWFIKGETGWIWLDLDNCRDPVNGAIDPWAWTLLEWAGETYAEVTPSGTGIRIAGTAGLDVPMQGTLRMERFLAGLNEAGLALWGGSREAAKGAQVEVFYACPRYVTVTGQMIAGRPARWGSLDVEIGGLALELWQIGQAQEPDRRPAGGGSGVGGQGGGGGGEDKTAPIEDVIAALDVIGNGDGWDVGLDWDAWSRIGMACWAATTGSADGFEAWVAWSARCEDKHNDEACLERWQHWERSPPRDLGMGVLAIEAGRATGGSWRRPSRTPEAEFDPVDEEEGEPGESPGTKGAIEVLGRRLIYVRDLNRFLDTTDGSLLDEARVKLTAGAMGIKTFTAKSARSIVARLVNHPEKVLRHARRMTLRPGEGELLTEGGVPVANTWRPSTLVPNGGDAGVWLEHMHRLIPDDGDRERVIDRLAWCLQNPGRKVNNALVLLGGQGAGKDTAIEPFWSAIGQHNYSVVQGAAVGGDFNGYLRRAWLLVTEMPPARKRSCYDEIKAWLTTPPNELSINMKGIEAFQIPNIVNVIVTTNHPGAIALAEDDRRFDVVKTAAAGGGDPAGYFKRLYDWLGASGNHGAVMGYLRARVSTFDPKAAPPMTEAKINMMREGAAPGVVWACSLWAPGGALAKREMITALEILSYASHAGFGASEGVRRSIAPEHIAMALRLSGWRNLDTRVADGATRPRPWTRAKAFELISQMPAKQLQEHLEEDRKQNANGGVGDEWTRA